MNKEKLETHSGFPGQKLETHHLSDFRKLETHQWVSVSKKLDFHHLGMVT